MNAAVWRILVVTASLGAATCAASAQHGPDYPSASDRGADFPKSVSPTDTNPTNWVGSPALHEDQGQSVAGRHWERPVANRRRWRG